ncbi:4Fe-4S dicluster domain-containing protein [Lentibacter algarum]|uniref:4Fe-4S dicluster domain-containing protein n=1 Tax=Lentibacter algarum TaxID=576131 RepID=UPI001C06CEB8|nr:4Fe-4S dicluster domain-containing protein [Lentibacter algarum]MBU2981532.1 4Fe-4S dicluster domain-containing protein [Lentibacter algarum]
MSKPSPYRPFTPEPEQMALKPAVSGNDINGLGEAAFRRPTWVYWAPDPDDIAHGDMQRWFYSVRPDEPALIKARAERQVILDAPIAELADSPIEQSDDAWLAQLRRFEADGTCERVGVTGLDPDWLYAGYKRAFSNVVICAVQHDYEEISKAPEPDAGGEVIRQYGRAAGAAKQIAGWLRSQGWEAEPLTGPMAGKLTMIPPALSAGLGELGKHGSIIDPAMGASFRLSAVLTDAPIAHTEAREHGIDEFCRNCRICEDACPPEALSADKQQVRGVEKWYVDFDKCLPFFNQHHGCAICIAVCPWSRPGIGLRLADKLATRAARKEAEG